LHVAEGGGGRDARAMPISIYTVDAFADAPFTGNPAAVCFPPAGASDTWLAGVAREMNLSETAFLWPEGDAFRLRWLTPAVEVDLCGHATLASAHVLYESGRLAPDRIARFQTRSGLLTAELRGDRIALDFPASPLEESAAPDGLFSALGLERARAVLKTRFDFMVVLDREDEVRALAPDFRALRSLGVRGVIATARSEGEQDFVSRFFAPGAGIDEDPVTGSAHCALAPYWSRALGKSRMRAYQASARGGRLEVEVRKDRVELSGRALTITRGELLA
jgi:PhzF family phenazine biosynthesis protein